MIVILKSIREGENWFCLFCLSLCLSANNISMVMQGQPEVKVSTGSRVIERGQIWFHGTYSYH